METKRQREKKNKAKIRGGYRARRKKIVKEGHGVCQLRAEESHGGKLLEKIKVSLHALLKYILD